MMNKARSCNVVQIKETVMKGRSNQDTSCQQDPGKRAEGSGLRVKQSAAVIFKTTDRADASAEQTYMLSSSDVFLSSQESELSLE
jgi:hypothetical protein